MVVLLLLPAEVHHRFLLVLLAPVLQVEDLPSVGLRSDHRKVAGVRLGVEDTCGPLSTLVP